MLLHGLTLDVHSKGFGVLNTRPLRYKSFTSRHSFQHTNTMPSRIRVCLPVMSDVGPQPPVQPGRIRVTMELQFKRLLRRQR